MNDGLNHLVECLLVQFLFGVIRLKKLYIKLASSALWISVGCYKLYFNSIACQGAYLCQSKAFHP